MPSRRTTRIALAAAIWLFVGALATVGLAWGLSINHQPGWEFAGRSSFHLPQPLIEGGWTAVRTTASDRTWCAIHVESDSLVAAGRAGGADRARDHGFLLWAVGWPLPAMQGWRDWKATGPQTFEEHPRFLYWWTRPDARFRAVVENVYIPLAPAWPGFAVDAIAFGMLAWLVVRGPSMTRRWLRRRSGRCLKCGYELTGLAPEAPCPECGTARA
ncbi:MAG TPA: hypothetical protein PKE29_04510 [Phycisphaerales bacterium]|nr:hypothetical protein [Phycisphaerales bacterium]